MARTRVLGVAVAIVIVLGLLWTWAALATASIGELEFEGLPSEVGYTSEEVQLEGRLKFNEKEHSYAQNIRLWVVGHEGRIEPKFIAGPLHDGETVPITVYLEGAPGSATLYADDLRCPLGSWDIELAPKAEVAAVACCCQTSINVVSGDGGLVTYRFTATSEDGRQDIEIKGTTEVEHGSHLIELDWGEELSQPGTCTFTWDVEFHGNYGSYAEDRGTSYHICKPEFTVSPTCNGAILNTTSSDGGLVTYQLTVASEDGQQNIELQDATIVDPGSQSIELDWGEELNRYGTYTFTWDANFKDDCCSSATASGTLTQTCNIVPQVNLTAQASCCQTSINITSAVSGQITYQFTATSEVGQQIVILEGTRPIEAEETTAAEPVTKTIELDWGEELNHPGAYIFTWNVEFHGNYGSFAEDSGVSHKICQPDVAAYADCDGAMITASSDGGEVTYRFAATSEDGQQVIVLEDTVEVDPGNQTIELEWGEELDRYGLYTFTWDVEIIDHYGSSTQDSGSRTWPCRIRDPSLEADANCCQATIGVDSEYGGEVTYQFTAASEDGQQVVQLEGSSEVGSGSQTIELDWGEELNRPGSYTFTWDVEFHGTYGSYAEDSGASHRICKPQVTAFASCDVVMITTASDGGEVTYQLTATSEDGQQVVQLEGSTEVAPGSQTIEIEWGEEPDRTGAYTFNWDVKFKGDCDSSAESSGSSSRICNLEVTYCCGEGLIYQLHDPDFIPYLSKGSASKHSLIPVTSPPAPEGWNQPDFVPDNSWQPGITVWWEDWVTPTWCPLASGCDATVGILPDSCSAIGILDKYGNPEACDGTTHLYRNAFTISPPESCMRVKRAVLDMWSDNKTGWWWQGSSISYGMQGPTEQIQLFPDYIGPHGGTYVLAIQNSNDYVSPNSNPHGTACRLRITWAFTRESCYHVYLPLLSPREYR